MPALYRNIFLLILSLILFFFVRSKMQQLMDSKEVVAFEFLRTEAATDALFQSPAWQSPADDSLTNKSDRLRVNTYWDFLFIFGYTLSLYFLARVLLGDAGRHVKTIGWVLLAAGVSDAMENLCLLQILDGSRGFFPAAMYVLASFKFGMLVVFGLLLVAGLVAKIKKKP